MEAQMGDRIPLLNDAASAERGGARRRPARHLNEEGRYEPPKDSGWDDSQPYGGKVYLARKKKDDPWWVLAIETLHCFKSKITVLLATAAFAYYSYYYFEHLHYHVTKGYAHLGYAVAQHQVGNKLLHGTGVDRDEHKAMEWFKLAADQGDPEASYSLAVGHINGVRTDLLARGEARKLIAHAAAHGVEEAHRALNEHCTHGHCDN